MNNLYSDVDDLGGVWESREYAAHPDHPIYLVAQVVGVPDNDVLGLDLDFELSAMWRATEFCSTSSETVNLLSFEALGEEPSPWAWSALFGWRATVQGPWHTEEYPDRPHPPDFIERGDAELWHLEMWIALVDTTLVVVATQGPKPAALDPRELLDTIIRRIEDDPPSLVVDPPHEYVDHRPGRG